MRELAELPPVAALVAHDEGGHRLVGGAGKERENGRESATARGWKGGAAGARARAPMNVLHCEPLFTHLPSRSHRRSSAGVPVPVCVRV